MRMPIETSYNREVVKLLQDCHDACREVFTACAPKESGRTLSFLHMKRLLACIEISGATANYLMKDGIKAGRLCEITATICNQCAHSCEKIDDELCQYAAGICRKAAKACLDEAHYLRGQGE